MKLDKAALAQAMRLYAVTDRSWLKAGETLPQAVEAAILGGATFVQLREKALDHDAFLQLALEVGAVCRKHGVPFVINDDVQIALECGADGVHVGQSDMAAAKAREILGPDKIIGVSAHDLQEALEARAQGADCLGVGTMFPTSTKLDAEAVSFEMLREICEAVDLPTVAIGGIGAHNLHLLNGTGIAGAAVVSAIFAAPDIQKAAGELRSLLDGICDGQKEA